MQVRPYSVVRYEIQESCTLSFSICTRYIYYKTHTAHRFFATPLIRHISYAQCRSQRQQETCNTHINIQARGDRESVARSLSHTQRPCVSADTCCVLPPRLSSYCSARVPSPTDPDLISDPVLSPPPPVPPALAPPPCPLPPGPSPPSVKPHSTPQRRAKRAPCECLPSRGLLWRITPLWAAHHLPMAGASITSLWAAHRLAVLQLVLLLLHAPPLAAE